VRRILGHISQQLIVQRRPRLVPPHRPVDLPARKVFNSAKNVLLAVVEVALPNTYQRCRYATVSSTRLRNQHHPDACGDDCTAPATSVSSDTITAESSALPHDRSTARHWWQWRDCVEHQRQRATAGR